MAWFGLKRKRSSEEQKAYDQKVYTLFRDKTIVVTERIFRFTHLDKAILWLQLYTERHRKGTIAVIGAMMLAVLVYSILDDGRPPHGGGAVYGLDSLVGTVIGMSSHYGDVFVTTSPEDFARKVVREMEIDTLRYRTDSLYNKEINKEFIRRYGRFGDSVGQ